MEQGIIKEIAQTVGIQIEVNIAAFTKDIWRTEFEAITNIKIPQSAIDGMVIEGIYFAIFYLGQRIKGFFNNEEMAQFNTELKNHIIWVLSELYFESPFKTTDPERHQKGVEGYVNAYFDLRMMAYSIFNEGNISLLFKKYLLQVFNSNDFKIKFVENTPKARFWLNFAHGLAGPNGKFANDTILDIKILDLYVKTIVDSLVEINVQQIVSEKSSKSYNI